MADPIPCGDYVFDGVGQLPKRPERANPDSLKNRWGNFVFSMDLSPEQKDELGAGIGAWSMWDIPSSNAAQIDDENGDDLITLSVQDNVYWLDWGRNQDEWGFNEFAPIHRLIRFGPLPSNEAATIPAGGYDPSKNKRLQEFQFSLRDAPIGAPGAKFTITVAEWNREDRTARTGQRKTAQRMRFQTAVKGVSFIVTVEHSSNEAMRIENWRAMWDTLGHRIREAEIVS
jgi:hypothetical protein